MADSAKEAVEKSKRLPIHEVYVHNQWFERAVGYEFIAPQKSQTGYKKK